MINFNFFLPTKVVFGKDTQHEVGKLVKAGVAVKEEISIEGADGKKHKKMAYKLA